MTSVLPQSWGPAPDKPSWSLNKVLQLASSIDSDQCSYQQLLRKTLFLIAPTSGTRLSEMAALPRAPKFAKFLHTGEALLSPHAKFLAKNEDPQKRWKPWKIITLPQDPSLCPVSTLRTYLEKIHSWTSGPLFRREKGGTISINGIRQQILYFIKEADPDSIPKAHQVRAIATSVNFFQHMDFPALTRYTGWKSHKFSCDIILKTWTPSDFTQSQQVVSCLLLRTHLKRKVSKYSSFNFTVVPLWLRHLPCAPILRRVLR